MFLDVYGRPLERCGDRGEHRVLRSYSRIDETAAELHRVVDVAELAELLARAERTQRKVTFRASGLSLHDQSLSDDMAISLEGLTKIEVDVGRREVTVQAGAKWGDVVEATLEHGLVPRVVPTSRHITCGGSLMTDGISRYSPSFGSESRHVKRLELLTVGSETPRWIDQPAGSHDNGPDAQLFRALVGSFGYLGVVTRITYDLMDVRHVGGKENAHHPLKVATRLWTHENFAALIRHQIALLEEPIEEDLEDWTFPDRPDPVKYPSVYTVAVFENGDGRGAVFESTYVRGREGPPYIIYQPEKWWRPWLGRLLMVSRLKRAVNGVVWWFMQRDSSDPTDPARDKIFVNEVADYMFFMDGDLKTKVHYERPPDRLAYVVQQTFVLPYAHRLEGKATKQKVELFLERMTSELAASGVTPTLFEFLFMPRDRILMSASYDQPGFAITLAFQDIADAEQRDAVIAVLKELSRICGDLDGRIHLTKNVYADDAVLFAMYGERMEAFLRLKQSLDPSGVLRNRFFDRIFERAETVGADGSR